MIACFTGLDRIQVWYAETRERVNALRDALVSGFSAEIFDLSSRGQFRRMATESLHASLLNCLLGNHSEFQVVANLMSVRNSLLIFP